MVESSESSRAVFEYLECPKCGTRYLARDPWAAERLATKVRWFHCHRCDQRVKSSASSRPGLAPRSREDDVRPPGARRRDVARG